MSTHDLHNMSIENTLKERRNVHGDYVAQFNLAQNYKRITDEIMVKHQSLNKVYAEALDMIFTKISRIVVGDPDHIDHWHDIVGYASLAEKHTREQIDKVAKTKETYNLQP